MSTFFVEPHINRYKEKNKESEGIKFMEELVIVKENQVVTSSLHVAETFNKQHGHVIRDVEQLEKDVSNFGEMFVEGNEPDSYGRPRRVFYMTKDGFTLLAFGFTGKKALQFKLQYIKAFNQMERQLHEEAQNTVSLEQLWKSTISSLKAEITAEVLAEIRNEMVVAAEIEAMLQYERELQQYDKLTSTKLAELLGFSGKGTRGAAQLNKELEGAGVLIKQHGSNGQNFWKVTEQWIELGLAVESTFAGYGNWVRWTQKGIQRIKQMVESGYITVV